MAPDVDVREETVPLCGCRLRKLNPTYLSGSERLPIRRAVVNMEVNRCPEAPPGTEESLNPTWVSRPIRNVATSLFHILKYVASP